MRSGLWNDQETHEPQEPGRIASHGRWNRNSEEVLQDLIIPELNPTGQLIVEEINIRATELFYFL